MIKNIKQAQVLKELAMSFSKDKNYLDRLRQRKASFRAESNSTEK
jgi:hypothetical protein